MDDAELMRRWQAGSSAAFEALVRRWEQPMARYLYRLTGDEQATSDLCQELFLRVCQAGSRYAENGVFSAWLYRIALNLARDRARSLKPVIPLAHEPITEKSEPGRTELRRAVEKAIAELPEVQRSVLAWRHDESLSFEEIARLTGTPASTWKSRFTAALKALRDKLTQAGFGPEELGP